MYDQGCARPCDRAVPASRGLCAEHALEPEDRGTWIEVDSRWSEVDWDLEWLVRAESALEVARAALAEA
ncbi:hypothetical protein [Olsenella sp. An293]|uniref:hypothetical protein n=1 Tax=Olsenella sp. An293 TaxID=1965626 RepID=UPI000B37E16B|nr:hypothetical protein [Olsenella sp. An293]OUO32731.1 hypothetical protein B5F85_05535 [Olsenella sp. An293]